MLLIGAIFYILAGIGTFWLIDWAWFNVGTNTI